MKRPMLFCVGTLMMGELAAGLLSVSKLAVIASAASMGLMIAVLAVFQIMKRKFAGYLILGLLVMAGGALCLISAKEQSQPPSLTEGQRVLAKGTVTYFSESSSGWNLYLENVLIELPNPVEEANNAVSMRKYGKILVRCREKPDFRPGNQVVLSLQYETFDRAANEGNFDELLYYYGKGIFFSGSLIRIEEKSESFCILPAFLLSCKEKWKRVFQSVYSKKNAAFYQGVLLGDGQVVDSSQKDSFRGNGIGHILAISGLHLSLAGRSIFKFCRKKRGYLFSGAVSVSAMLAFCYLTGSSAATLRAFLMFGMSAGAMAFGRSEDVLSNCSAAAIFLLLENPFYLFDSGFQMSFSCIILIQIVIPEFVRFCHIQSRWKKMLSSSVFLQVLLTPVTAYYYFSVPAFGFLLNLIVIPSMTITVGSGIACMLVGMVWEKAAVWMAGPGFVCIYLYEFLCSAAEKLPYHKVLIGKPSGAVIILFYLTWGIFFFYCRYRNRRENAKEILFFRPKIIRYLSLLSFELCSILALRPEMKEEVALNHLDVGQGDCCVIRENGGYNVMIDGGSTSVRTVGKYRIVPYLESQRVDKLDYVMISHPDTDHINGILEILSGDEISVGTILIAGYSENDNYAQLLAKAEEAGTEIVSLSKGLVLKGKYITFTCLYPDEDGDFSDINESSAVMLASWNHCSALFTGDIGEKTEQILLQEGRLPKVDWLKAAHHGSAYSSCDDFLDMAGPGACVISAGKNNSYGHPHKETLERIRKITEDIYITYETGCVTVTGNRGVKSITTYAQKRRESLLERIMAGTGRDS